MRLLIITQKIDATDSTLGFFQSWVRELASQYESISVICLEKGTYDLPPNVTVYSLGKETKKSKLSYFVHFYHYLFVIRGSYDKVFVHMNQEYVLLAGLYWKLSGIPVYFWRNHPKGNIFTYGAVFLSTKIFCTSSQSFTARFKKTKIMPAGVDTNIFKPVPNVVRMKYSLCVVGRIAPIKHIDIALEAMYILVHSGVQASLTIVGSALPKDKHYFESLESYVVKHDLSSYVVFRDAVSPKKLPEIYSSHQICLNMTDDGSFDKTIVEATACGAIPLVSNTSLSKFLPEACITLRDAASLAQSIEKILEAQEQIHIHSELSRFVAKHSLHSLMGALSQEMNP